MQMQNAGTKCVRTCTHLLSQAGRVGFGSGGRIEHSSLGRLKYLSPHPRQGAKQRLAWLELLVFA